MAFWSNPSELLPKQSHRWVITYGNSISGKKNRSIDEDGTLTYYFAKSVDKPSYEIGVVQAKYMYNHTINFPKRLQWKPIKLEIMDINHRVYAGKQSVIELNGQTIPTYDRKTKHLKSSQLFFYSFLRKAGYADPEIEDSYNNLLTNRTYTFKKNMTKAFTGEPFDHMEDFEYQSSQRMYIHDLNENGSPMEIWEIANPLVTSVSFGKLDYASDNALSINVDLSYDWAKLIVPDEVTETTLPIEQPAQEEEEEEEEDVPQGSGFNAFFGGVEINGDPGAPDPNSTEMLSGRTRIYFPTRGSTERKYGIQSAPDDETDE